MSYPDQEKQLEKVSEKVDIPQKPKSSPNEARIRPDSRLPVGKLKWSKDQEEEQNTRINLEKKKAEPERPQEPSGLKALHGGAPQENVPQEPKGVKPAPAPAPKDSGPAPQNRPERAEPIRAELSSDPSGDRGNHSPSPEQHKTPETVDASKERTQGAAPETAGFPVSQPPKKPLSLEDTLTPIHFKEYSIDPLPEEPKKEEAGFRTELKKPAFVAETPDFDPKATEEDLDLPEEKTGLRHPAVRTAVKILWLPTLLVVSLVTGLIVGHSVIGNEPAGDVFDMEMWEHVYHLING